ncbi:Gfo/Idh/MocA family oxidoreductase [Candidatus Sumerlaeota bacterium]|nr:Gfo/Idh/MocA family oxidoreductase [Candidatus Sumerlaeota bacterium]
MAQEQQEAVLSGIGRRSFIRSAALTGAGLALAPAILRAQDAGKSDALNIALIGAGRQGKILLGDALKITDVPLRVKAVCDMWEYSSRRAQAYCKAAKQETKFYATYQEMLAQESDLDAVIIATPDFVHHEHTNACLNAGLHVYCEKEMSNDLSLARSMVETARKTGKLLQIGHQRRSNPYYKHAYNLMHKEKFFGDIVTMNGQWNQRKPITPLPSNMLSKYGMTKDYLARYGYGSMEEFYEWRWFEKYSGGPMTDLGSHQIDVFNWFQRMNPSSVYAVGGNQFALSEAKANNAGYTPESFDHTIAIYEYKQPWGVALGSYQVDLRTSHGLFFEQFMGPKGSLIISELTKKNAFFKEASAAAPEWLDEASQAETKADEGGMKIDPQRSKAAEGHAGQLTAEMNKNPHQLHIENFLKAIRGEAELTCPAEEAYAVAVSVLKANQAAKAGGKIEFKPEDFKA